MWVNYLKSAAIYLIKHAVTALHFHIGFLGLFAGHCKNVKRNKTTDFGQIRTRIIGAWGKHITMALEL